MTWPLKNATTAMSYHVFSRTWWKDSPGWPDNLEPAPSHKDTIDLVETEAEARALCAEFRKQHEPGRYSLKAEYEEI